MTEYTYGPCHDGGECLRVSGVCLLGKCDRREVAAKKSQCDPSCTGDDSESHCVRSSSPYCQVTAYKAWVDEAMRLADNYGHTYGQYVRGEVKAHELLTARESLEQYLEKRAC